MTKPIELLAGVAAGFVLGKSVTSTNDNETSNLVEVQTLQSAVNKSLLDAMQYEAAIRDLQNQLEAQRTQGPTVDFLKLQLQDLTENYELLMTYARSKIGELPTSFTVTETNVDGLHINPLIFFDRAKYDRNLKIVDGALVVNGLANFKVPIYAYQGGQWTELRSSANPDKDAFLVNLDSTDLAFQIRIGPNERDWELNSSDVNQMVEPLLLIEFDKNVDLRILMNNIVWGTARHSGVRWDLISNGGIYLYRRNILAFKVLGMTTYHNGYLLNLVLKTLTGTQQLMINSVALVDSLHSSAKMYQAAAGHNHMTESYKLIGKARPFE